MLRAATPQARVLLPKSSAWFGDPSGSGLPQIVPAMPSHVQPVSMFPKAVQPIRLTRA
jgi:hypothetical protein